MARPSQVDPKKSVAGQIGMASRWSKTTDRAAATIAARQAFDAKFEQMVDPDGTLDPELRAKLAESARREHFLRMRLRREQNRRERAAAAKSAKTTKTTKPRRAS